MGFFSNFLSTISTKDDIENPLIQFGKYSDRNKTPAQLESWTKSTSLFNEQKYLDAFEEFFIYLKDPVIENVLYTRKKEQIDFKLYQGSKIVKGYINNEEVYIISEVVQFDKVNVAVMRRLLVENYYLWYSKFSKNNNVFTLQHRTPTKDEHPTSLYFAIKEVANVADSFDDTLVDEFPFLKPINLGAIEKLPTAELNIKLNYFKKTIDETLESINKLSASRFKGAISFSLLNIAYKIYYLFAPEGTLLDEVRHIHSIFWSKNKLTDEIKNQKMIEEFEKLSSKSNSEISKSLYKVTSTFPQVKPTHHDKVHDFVKREIEKIHWYRENKYYDIHLAICEYIVSYCTFVYGTEPVIIDLFQVFWKVTNHKYFTELGFVDEFVKNDKIILNTIEKRINKIISSNKNAYPNLVFNSRRLNTSSLHEFASSFLYEFINCEFNN